MSDSLTLSVITSPTRAIPGPGSRTFSPITSTLIAGPTEIAVVDTHFLLTDVTDVADAIAASGKTLRAILITHAHGDHYFGSALLVQRFPTARVVSTARVAARLAATFDHDVRSFVAMFGDDVVVPSAMPAVSEAEAILIDNVEVQIIDVGQGDIADSAIMYVPSLAAVVAGDVVYNGIHQMLGLGGPAEWKRWIASVDAIERLAPKTVIAGHKMPEASNDVAVGMLDATRAYIRDFARALEEANSVEELVGAMQRKYPDHGNVTTLLFSAHVAMKRKAATVELPGSSSVSSSRAL